MGRQTLIDNHRIIAKIIESQELDCTVPTLALHFGVSRGTINNAVKKLVALGKLRERRRLANLRIYEAV